MNDTSDFIVDSLHVIKYNDKRVWDIYFNGQIRNKSFEKLFKFYSAIKDGNRNSDSFDSLKNGYLYLSNPESFNDPFDCSINLLDGPKLSKYIKGSSTNNYPRNGVCSLTSELDNHLMWSHYTNKYNGFVIEFKSDKEIKLYPNISHIHLWRQVIYSDSPRKIKKEHKASQFYVMLTKLKQWEYEHEWRIVGRVDDPNIDFERKLEYDKNSIRAIYIGYKLKEDEPELYEELANIIKTNYPAANVYLVKPHEYEFRLDISLVSL